MGKIKKRVPQGSAWLSFSTIFLIIHYKCTIFYQIEYIYDIFNQPYLFLAIAFKKIEYFFAFSTNNH
jgi:hypothetical protein